MDSVYVDKVRLSNIYKMAEKDRKTRIIFLPTYKSYSDPLLLHYINFFSNLELGFTFGYYEDTAHIGFVDRLIKRIGGMMLRSFP